MSRFKGFRVVGLLQCWLGFGAMWVALGAALCVALPLLALPAHAADAKAEAADAAAAMERAKRQAANPMKAILEASKVKRKVVGEPDLPSAVANIAAATAAATTTATATTPAPNAVTAPPATLVALRASGIATAALSSASTRNSTWATAGTAAAEALPTLTTTEPIAPSPVLPSAATPTAALAPGWVQPRLIDMVEPAIPARVLDDLGGLLEVRADLNLRADGSVASVTLVQPVPRQLTRYVITALERWRFAPLPADQVHRVQLVFNEQR